MKKIASLVAAVAMVPVLLASTPVFADSPGQLSNSPTNYKVRNVTKNGAYSQSVAAACGETVKYSIILSNSDFGQLKNLTVKANLKTGDISASATTVTNTTTSVSGKATVTTSGVLEYIPGSTVRITEDTKNRTTVANGIAANGVNVGDLAGSTAIFVQFEAKVKCDKPVTPETPETPETPTTPEKPAELVKTGAGDVAAIIAAATAMGVAGYSWFLRRQNAR